MEKYEEYVKNQTEGKESLESIIDLLVARSGMDLWHLIELFNELNDQQIKHIIDSAILWTKMIKTLYIYNPGSLFEFAILKFRFSEIYKLYLEGKISKEIVKNWQHANRKTIQRDRKDLKYIPQTKTYVDNFKKKHGYMCKMGFMPLRKWAFQHVREYHEIPEPKTLSPFRRCSSPLCKKPVKVFEEYDGILYEYCEEHCFKEPIFKQQNEKPMVGFIINI